MTLLHCMNILFTLIVMDKHSLQIYLQNRYNQSHKLVPKDKNSHTPRFTKNLSAACVFLPPKTDNNPPMDEFFIYPDTDYPTPYKLCLLPPKTEEAFPVALLPFPPVDMGLFPLAAFLFQPETAA